MKEKPLFWLLSALFVISCVCIILGSALIRQSDAVYVSSISSPAVSAENAASAPPNEVSPSDTSSTSSLLININTASKEELESLPGIGDVIAERIVTYREENGGFDTVEEIMKVSGIGEKKFEAIKDMIIV